MMNRLCVSTLLMAWAIGVATPAAQTPPRADGHGKYKLEDFNRWLGVECTHCHLADKWADDSKPAKVMARKMVGMMPVVNSNLRGVGEVTCWACHRGELKQAQLPREALDAELTRWPKSIANANQVVKLQMAMYSASTGLRCGQCHDTTDWKRKDTDKIKMVPRMQTVFGVIQPFMPSGSRTQCYTCHKGASKPERSPPAGSVAAQTTRQD
jgi:hypothetical protein